MARNSKNGAGSEDTTAQKSNGSSNGGVTGLLDKVMGRNKAHTLDLLFEKGLNDIYDAEKQLVDALPDLEEAAQNENLKAAFAKHLRQTKKQVERLDKIFNHFNIDKTGD